MQSKTENFIIENRLKMSVGDMCSHLGVSRQTIVSFIKDEDLELTVKEAQRIRNLKSGNRNTPKNLKYKSPKWVRDPWNNGINLITMHKTAGITKKF